MLLDYQHRGAAISPRLGKYLCESVHDRRLQPFRHFVEKKQTRFSNQAPAPQSAFFARPPRVCRHAGKAVR